MSDTICKKDWRSISEVPLVTLFFLGPNWWHPKIQLANLPAIILLAVLADLAQGYLEHRRQPLRPHAPCVRVVQQLPQGREGQATVVLPNRPWPVSESQKFSRLGKVGNSINYNAVHINNHPRINQPTHSKQIWQYYFGLITPYWQTCATHLFKQYSAEKSNFCGS